MKQQIVRPLVIGMAFVITVSLVSGCASWRKKFIRKKKVEEEMPHYRQVQEYNVGPSLELYTKHYIYYKNWHREIVENLGDNSKKDKRSVQEMIGHLEEMKAMLSDAKGDELQEHIAVLQGIENDLTRSGLTPATITRIRHILEKEQKLIKVEFSYTKMEPFIRDDFRRREL